MVRVVREIVVNLLYPVRTSVYVFVCFVLTYFLFSSSLAYAFRKRTGKR